MVPMKLEKVIDLFSIEIKMKSQKIDMSTLSFILILKLWYFYQCTGLEIWYWEISSNHAKSIELCPENFFWNTKKFDMGPNRERKDQNENWALMNGGGFVRRGDRFFHSPCFKTDFAVLRPAKPEQIHVFEPEKIKCTF